MLKANLKQCRRLSIFIKTRSLHFSALMLFLSSLGGVAQSATTANEIQRMVLRSNSKSVSADKLLSPNGGVIVLEPDSNSCVDEACQFGSCSLDKDTQEIAKACGANTSGNCVRESCNHSGCSSKADLLSTIRSCHGNVGGGCVQEVCSRIGCNFTSDTHEIALACKAANGGCVRSVCEKTGCSLKATALSAIESCTEANE